MNGNFHNVALIPARGGSKSIRHKNIKSINGRPLIYWALDAAVSCDVIDKVFVSTEDDEINKVVQQYGSDKVEVIGRSHETATDTASTESVMLEFAEKVHFDNIILIQATSPLLGNTHLEQGLLKLEEQDVDSVLSAVRQKRFVWEEKEGFFHAVNYIPNNRPMRQKFSGFLVENGAFYITSRERLLSSKCRISGNIKILEMPEETYFEIDEPEDWIIVEQFLRRKHPKEQAILGAMSKIKAVFMDCDGVLTDGGMYYSEKGDELKKFNTKDGMSVSLLKDRGFITGVITGENIELVKRRCEKLNIDELHMGVKDKMRTIEALRKKYGLKYEEIAYIGDDINDLEVIKKAGLGFCPADGMEIVKEASDYVTKAKGGAGTVREVAELLIEHKI